MVSYLGFTPCSEDCGLEREFKAKTLKDYKSVLNEAGIKEVGKRLNALSKTQLEYFAKPKEEIQPVRNGISAVVNPSKAKPLYLRTDLEEHFHHSLIRVVMQNASKALSAPQSLCGMFEGGR